MEDLFNAAATARNRAYAPYSLFPVGAAVRSESGVIYAGANVENASFPEGWCAETSALAALVGSGERRITEVLVVADHKYPVTPCGGCRQRLAEFGSADTLVISCGPEGERGRWTLAELLPAAFGLVE